LSTENVGPLNEHITPRRFLHLLSAVSVMFCSRPFQTSPVTFWIHQQPRHIAARWSNFLILILMQKFGKIYNSAILMTGSTRPANDCYLDKGD